jgi:sugar/nucleoside kinase (ribokinase family)
MKNKKYDLLAVGELLADFLGTTITANLIDAAQFERFQGGSPSNLAANMARLGGQTAIVSCVGDDNVGKYLIEEVAKTGVETQHVAIDAIEPSSIVVVSRTAGTPDFIAYRTADRMIQPNHISDELLAESQIFHTTCFALSQNPAQSTIIDAAKRAVEQGCHLSIDLNYSPKIWPNRADAQAVIEAYISNGAMVKVSEDDAERIYGRKISNEEIIVRLHDMGASLICLTLGAEGSIISTEGGSEIIQVPGRKIEVVDATGAGDSYWAGFLTAYLVGYPPEVCANAGANIAQKKLGIRGPLPANLDRSILYEF